MSFFGRFSRRLVARAVASVGLGVVVLAALGPSAAADNYEMGDGYKLHWNRTNTSVAQAYMVDYTGPRWPVNASTVKWNEASRLGVYYLSSTDSCPFHCVAVKADYFGTAEARGFSIIRWDSNGHLTGNTYIRLNNSYAANSTKDRSVTCQEVGHAIGLDHQGSGSDSCMTNSPDRFPMYPNRHDYDILYSLYDH